MDFFLGVITGGLFVAGVAHQVLQELRLHDKVEMEAKIASHRREKIIEEIRRSNGRR